MKLNEGISLNAMNQIHIGLIVMIVIAVKVFGQVFELNEWELKIIDLTSNWIEMEEGKCRWIRNLLWIHSFCGITFKWITMMSFICIKFRVNRMTTSPFFFPLIVILIRNFSAYVMKSIVGTTLGSDRHWINTPHQNSTLCAICLFKRMIRSITKYTMTLHIVTLLAAKLPHPRFFFLSISSVVPFDRAPKRFKRNLRAVFFLSSLQLK